MQRCACVDRAKPTSTSSATPWLHTAGIRAARFVSFRFSSLRISLRYARGDLGAQPPTRELVNYFAQRDTSFMALLPSVLSCLLLPFRAVRTFAPRFSLAGVRAFSHCPGRVAYDICSEVQPGGGGSFQVATKCISRRRARFCDRYQRGVQLQLIASETGKSRLRAYTAVFNFFFFLFARHPLNVTELVRLQLGRFVEGND